MSASTDLNERASLRAMTHRDPTANLSHQLGQEITHAKGVLEDFVRSLARLSATQEQLRGKGIEVTVDLGEVGNAAWAAHRQVSRVHRTTFSFPASR